MTGIKDGILLEVWFDDITPNFPKTISSWAYDFAVSKVPIIDNRAVKLMRQYMEENPDVDENQLELVLERLKNITKKQVGVIELDADLDIETVTEIFIRINREGVPLSQADFAMSKIASRALWNCSNDKKAKLAMAIGLSLRGSYCMYQGEELGLPQADLTFEELVDPYDIMLYPEHVGRDGCRTPMPWKKTAPHSGFSQTTQRTWLPIPNIHNNMAVEVSGNKRFSYVALTIDDGDRSFIQKIFVNRTA
jgi:hypothetical protein